MFSLTPLRKFVESKQVDLFSYGILFSCTVYFAAKKITGISVSKGLASLGVSEHGVGLFVSAVLISLILAALFSFLKKAFEIFPPGKTEPVDPDDIASCLHNMNTEISEHVRTYRERSEKPNISTLTDQHKHDINVRLIIRLLANHITRTAKRVGQQRNLFITLYRFDCSRDELILDCYFPDNKSNYLNSTVIYLDHPDYSDYASVKCMKSNESNAYAFQKKHYKKSNAKRYKTLRHYIGCKVASSDKIFAFLNIEFHKNHVFDSEDDMSCYTEEEIYPFLKLLEYQYLKKDFFEILCEIDDDGQQLKVGA